MNISKINYYFFMTAYSLFLAFSVFGHIEILKVSLKYLTYLSIFLLILNFFLNFKKYTKKEILILLVVFALSLVYGIKNSDYTLFKIWLILIGLKNIDINKCIKFDFILRIIYFIIMVCLFNLEVAKDVGAYFQGNYRSSLGFANPNVCGMYILILSFELMYLKLNKIKFSQIILFIILAVFSDVINGSRSTTLIMILGVLMFIGLYIKSDILENRLLKKIILNSTLIIAIIVVILTILYIYKTKMGVNLNEFLSYRLYNIADYIKNYGPSFFGHNLMLENEHTIDTALVYIYLRYGISGLIIYAFAFKNLFNFLYETKNYLLIIIMFCFNIYGINERLWINVDYNIFIIVFSLLLFNKEKLIGRKNEKSRDYYIS